MYSQADRCERCDMRAVLTDDTARALVLESHGVLEMYPCPDEDAWHVWSPVAEQDSAHRPRLEP